MVERHTAPIISDAITIPTNAGFEQTRLRVFFLHYSAL